jgi:CDP-diacylglycerol--glycerol-3-phosphate 3-phosphatidyltransferase/cardiolipin synthase
VPASAYRPRDLLLAPNLLSAARIPLAAIFPFTIGHTQLSLGVLGAAAVTDVLDGYLARKLGQATPVGALVDGVADKAFGASVLLSLVASRMVSPVAALLLATRELGELPLALRVLASKRARLTELDRRANALGKAATVLELGTVVAVVAHAPFQAVLLGATAVCGLLAAVTYWAREIRASREGSARSLEGAPRMQASHAST